MKKLNFLLTMVALLFAMSMTQNVMAKKKIYLGHEYKGKLNKQKRPEGQGTINVGDLLIRGIFNDRSVTDAEVIIADHIEGPHNCRFNGTITYDESNNIVLKADGIFSTRYLEGRWSFDGYVFEKAIMDAMTELKDTLKEDRIVNSDNFEVKQIQVPYTYELKWHNDEFGKLGFSNAVKTHCTLYLRSAIIIREVYNNTIKYNTSLFALHYTVNCPIDKVEFIDNKGRTLIGVINQKDGEIESFMVKYPNGSFFDHYFTAKDEVYKIVYPDGNALEIITPHYATRPYVSIGNGFTTVVKNALDYFIDVVENKSQEPIEVSEIYNEILGENYDYKGDRIRDNMKHPDLEVEELIKDMLKQASPHIKIASNFPVYLNYYEADCEGWFKDGKYISRVTRDKNAEEADNKKAQAKYNNLCKQYGKKYVDAAYADKFLIGMPLEVLDITGKWGYRKVSETANTVTLDAYYIPYNNPRYRLYLTNRKITRIYQYNY